MKKICFVCLGNICRSVMAEYIMKSKIKSLGLENNYYITSRAISDEESGNDIYPPAKEELTKHNISYERHYATQLLSSDYEKFDYFICMDDSNIKNINYIFNDTDKKVFKLLENDIADPWYTRDFTKTYNELDKGIDKLIENTK